MKAVVVLSGGQDSATCLALAVKKYGPREVAAITFAYGQRHAIETKYARQLVKLVPRTLSDAEMQRQECRCPSEAGLKGLKGCCPSVAGLKGQEGRCSILHKVVRFGFYKELTNNALLDPAMAIKAGSPLVSRVSLDAQVVKGESDARGKRDKSQRNSTLQLSTSTSTLTTTPPPNTVVEGRNAFFLMAAAVWAKTLGATELYTGVSQTDYSGYPDCRADFIRAQQKALRLALDYPITIVTPFMKMTKADEWALAAKLGIFELIRDHTVTCYNGLPGAGCGKCPACRLRNRGLRDYLKNRKD